jgi:hypothetical protein
MEMFPPAHSSHIEPGFPPPPSILTSTTPAPKRGISPLRFMLWFMKTLPLVFWGSVWIVIFGVSTLSIQTLLNLNASDENLIQFNQPTNQLNQPNLETQNSATAIALSPSPSPILQPSPSSAAAIVQPPVNPEEGISLWLFGGIALSCLVGAILVAKELRPARPETGEFGADLLEDWPDESSQFPPPRRDITHRPKGQPKRLALYSPQENFPFAPAPSLPKRSREGKKIPVFHVANPDRTFLSRLIPSPTTTKSTVQSTDQLRSRLVLQPTQPPPTAPVAVVSPQQNHPLDWGEASLADSLDLRRVRSLDSFMGDR